MRSYLRGEWRQGGWWYYYLYALAIKIPLGTWALVLMAVFLGLWKKGYSATWRDEVVVLAPLVCILALVSSQTGFNHHLRYVLPIFPFLFVWVSKVAQATLLGTWKVSTLAAAVVVWSIASSLSVYPHSLSYFNEFVGGPRGGDAHLLDSNIDWGQDLLYLRRWLDEHREAQPLGLAYFGYFDPRVASMEFTLPPFGPTSRDGEAPAVPTGELGPQPGWYAVSVSILYGHMFNVTDGDGRLIFLDKPYYTYFRHFEPIAMAGYSIYIYQVTLEEANRVRRELGLDELDDPSTSR